MAKLTDKFFNRVIEGKFVAESGDELPKELPEVSVSDNGKVLKVSAGKWAVGDDFKGTKLYRHLISASMTSSGQGDIDTGFFYFISTNPNQYEGIPQTTDGDIILVYGIININDTGTPHYQILSITDDPVAFGINIGTITATYPVISEIGIDDFDSITDTVTEL